MSTLVNQEIEQAKRLAQRVWPTLRGATSPAIAGLALWFLWVELAGDLATAKKAWADFYKSDFGKKNLDAS